MPAEMQSGTTTDTRKEMLSESGDTPEIPFLETGNRTYTHQLFMAIKNSSLKEAHLLLSLHLYIMNKYKSHPHARLIYEKRSNEEEKKISQP